jgi:hypothetical protein
VHLCFLKKVGERCGCVYGTKGGGRPKKFGNRCSIASSRSERHAKRKSKDTNQCKSFGHRIAGVNKVENVAS